MWVGKRRRRRRMVRKVLGIRVNILSIASHRWTRGDDEEIREG